MRGRTGRIRFRLGLLAVVVGAVVVAFGFAGAAYASLNPSSTTTSIMQGGSAVTSVAAGSSVTDQATVAGSGGFTCPSTDEAGFPLGYTSTYPIFCSYPAFPGENPDDFYCIYNSSTGSLVTDNDAGFCPAKAVGTTSAGTPTGTVTFTFFTNGTCTSPGTAGTPVTLTSGVATSASSGALTAGSYSFQASYSGDGDYATSTGTCEPLTVTLDPSSTVTSVMQGGSAVTAVAAGSSVTDQATVSGSAGTPTGTVTFTFFTNGTCTSPGTAGTLVTLASGVATSASSGALTAGSYSFQASYSGDGDYATSTGTCEPLTVTLDPSSTVTSVMQGGSAVTAVAAGSSVTDQATVSGSAGTPTGTVTFTFFTNGTCTSPGTAGTPVTLVSGVATSASSGALTTGSHSYQATYNGNSIYGPSTGACEPFTVVVDGLRRGL